MTICQEGLLKLAVNVNALQDSINNMSAIVSFNQGALKGRISKLPPYNYAEIF